MLQNFVATGFFSLKKYRPEILSTCFYNQSNLIIEITAQNIRFLFPFIFQQSHPSSFRGIHVYFDSLLFGSSKKTIFNSSILCVFVLFLCLTSLFTFQGFAPFPVDFHDDFTKLSDTHFFTESIPGEVVDSPPFEK